MSDEGDPSGYEPSSDQRWADLVGKRDREIERLKAAIREHRDQHGDDRCWEDDAKLYVVLGEPVPERPLPPPEEMLGNCRRYIQHRHDPTVPYVSPQRIIERLTKELHDKEKMVQVAARARLDAFMDALDIAVGLAKIMVPDGEVKLGLIARRPDKSGQIAADFDWKTFREDVLAILAEHPILDDG